MNSTAQARVNDAAEFPTYRAVVAHVTGGLDGVLRVVTLLRGRVYRVRDLEVEVREGVVESRVGCTALLTSGEIEMLLARLRRMPSVVSAEHG
ncbi:hypothetical protein [Pseudonocardia acaciae]|uniref:hypothetical protein n=1 Tax=Pseudonocardia acaciae TaxID=551276 RepID=UPI0006886417|nr:hypothetical protein [Pseudonocardia acaciae]